LAGELHLGVDDSGKISGLVDYKKLLDDLPNKILSKLGIIARID
jgi:ATP-dependent DNA helicase RecG